MDKSIHIGKNFDNSGINISSMIHTHLRFIESVKVRLKVMHWNAASMNAHVMCDEVAEIVNEYQDAFAENSFGIAGISKMTENSFLPHLIHVNTITELLEELSASVIDIRMKFELMGDGKFIGLIGICDGFIPEVTKYIYLSEMD